MQINTVALAALMSFVTAADSPPNCGVGMDACPEEYPCCSIEGTCGNGYVCLGGCDPRYSNTPGSCMPMPVCQDQKYTLSTDQFTNYTDYRGDASSNPFIYVGNVQDVDGKVHAIISEDQPAATITLSRYVWYGKVSLTMKASHGEGVISDFILLSDDKDEIDYEMVGSKTTQAQTNYYWQGVLNYENMIAADVEDVNQNTITYTIDWTEDKIDWIINGNTVRTLNKADTKNDTTGEYSFPQTPCRVQFGLWAAGDSPYQGTSQWAGGNVDWSAAGDDGYYVEVSELDVQCYDAPSGTTNNGDVSYIYTNSDAYSSDVALSGNSTILVSLDGTGENPCGSQCDDDSSSSADSSDGGATLGGSVASSTQDATLSGSAASSTEDATLSGSEASSTEDATLSGSSSASATESSDDSSASASETSSASSKASSGSSGSSASASGSSSASAASSSGDSTASSANGAAALGAAAILAPLAFLL